MVKALIITEKPSVARDLTRVLGGFTPRAGQAYWERDDYLCTYAVGHILTLLAPEDIDPAYRSWRLATLPILPKDFKLKPVPGQEARIKVIRDLAFRDDVHCLINACDAAREGELIFREIVQFIGCRKWVRRLWLQSMTPEAIRAAFDALRDGTDFDGLGAAAECRARADWLIGMNATRAFSERLRHPAERKPWSVGRVQTPTLALLVERELKILEHVPRPYRKIVASFRTRGEGAHEYEGTWFDPGFKADDTRPELKDDRLFDPEQAAAILAAIRDQTGSASETREQSQRHAPYLFNLTALQKTMATRFKWTAKRTLEAAQRCYEQHKVLTYPRTSSSCLPRDYRGEVDRLIEGFAGDPTYGPAARYLKQHGLRNEKRTFSDDGVDDHFAIIPTGTRKALSGDDAKLYDAVVRRFLATFHPPAVYDKVKRLSVVGEHHFRTGPVETLVIPGWLGVYDRESEAGGAPKLPPLVPGAKAAEGVPAAVVSARETMESTKPPPRINEAGLLSLMEHAGRHVDNEELAQALISAEGLGTAATRADIIQNLKAKEYVDEQLRPTTKGIHLISTLKRVQAARLTSPELTARLELELTEVEKGTRAAASFMGEIARYTQEVVEIAKGFDLDRLYAATEPLGDCPLCKRPVREQALDYGCDGRRQLRPDGRPACGFGLPKELRGRYLDRVSVAALLKDGETAGLEGFRDVQSGRGRLRLTGEQLLFVNEAGEAEPAVRAGAKAAGSPARASKGGGARSSGAKGASKGPARERRVVGRCPVHSEKTCEVIETRAAYVCETRLDDFAAGVSPLRGVMIPKMLCRRELSEPELRALLEKGMTAELAGFMSKAGRPFKACLKLNPDGTVGFEFTTRPLGYPGPGKGTGKAVAYPSRRAGRTARRPRRPRSGEVPT